MKPFPQLDFPVSVRRQTAEVEPRLAQLYDGIFNVRLNFSIIVMFVPFFGRSLLGNDFPWLPDNIDNVSTALEARQVAAGLSNYTVTPEVALAGTEECVPREVHAGEDPITLFYVVPEEFAVFASELTRLADQLPAVHDSLRISQLSDLHVARFLLSRVVHPKHLSAYELYLLGR